MLSSAQAIYGRPSYGFMCFLNCPNIDVAPPTGASRSDSATPMVRRLKTQQLRSFGVSESGAGVT